MFITMHRARCAQAAGALTIAIMLSVPAAARAQARAMIEHIEPTSGPPGTRVLIVGRGFRPTARVLFNEHELPIQERLPERLAVQVPAGAQSGRFVVAHGNDEVESQVFSVTAPEPPPTVTSIEPTSVAPGGEVAIHGTHFAARTTDNLVRMGTTPLTVRSGDPTTLRVIIPDGVASGPITIRTAGGEAVTGALTVTARVVIRDFAPTGTSPGGHVVLHGSGFAVGNQPNRVTVGGRPVRVLRASPNEMEIEVPRDAQAGGAIVVEVPGAGRFETGSQLRVAPAPLIRAVEPPQAPAGTRITLRGDRFGSDASAVQVSLGQTAAQIVTVAPGEIVVAVPRGASSGRWNVTVGGIGPVQSPADFNVLEPVTVTAFSPRAGDVGDHVTITGTGFSADPAQLTVRLGILQSHVISATPRQIEVEVPAAARSGQWSVTVAGNGEGRSHDPFMVTLRPRITAMEPDRAIVGDQVTIRGQNFPTDRALVQVRLQDTECEVVSTAREAIVVTVPRGMQQGAARFSVIARLQGTGRAEQDFHVLIPVTISVVEPVAAPVGAHVSLRGEGFETDPHVLHLRLGTVTLRPTRSTTTEIEFVVPRNAVSGEITIEAAQRQTATAHFAVQTPPVIQSIAPAQGAVGARVTIHGRNFGTDVAALRVQLGEAVCTVASVSPTTIVTTIPQGASTGRFLVRVQGQGEISATRDFRVTGGGTPTSSNPPSRASTAPAAH